MNSWFGVAARLGSASYPGLRAESGARERVIARATASDSAAVAANGEDRIDDMQCRASIGMGDAFAGTPTL